MSMTDIIREEARLRILEALADQPDRRWNSEALREDLSLRWAITRNHDWIAGEIAWLADMGLVDRTPTGRVVIVALTRKGVDHVEGAALAPGVKRPDPRM